MAWFKTDDKLPDHRKTRSVRKSHPVKRRDSAPFGLWVQAGAWSSDGFVPLEILEDWDDDAFELAERLVAAGMWHPTRRDGEPGYVFHDWADQNPAKDDNDPSSTGSFGNHIRWHVQRRIIEETCRHCPKEPDWEEDLSADDRPDVAPIIGGDIGVRRPESLPSRPDPTIPDPTRARPGPATHVAANDPDDRFEEFWETYGKKVDKRAAEQKWKLALRKPGVTAEVLIAAAAAYVLWERTENEGGRYIMGPAKWLLNERWTDERPARPAPQTRVQEHLALVRQLEAREQAEVLPFGQIGGGS